MEELLIFSKLSINEQYPILSLMKAHFYISNWLVRVAVTTLFTLLFDKQRFGFQKYSVACFDKWPLIMIDKRRHDPLWNFSFRNRVTPDSIRDGV